MFAAYDDQFASAIKASYNADGTSICGGLPETKRLAPPIVGTAVTPLKSNVANAVQPWNGPVLISFTDGKDIDVNFVHP